MRKRLLFSSGAVLLALLVTFLVLQGSFSFGDYAPSDPGQTFVYWAVSTIVFILTVALGFILARESVKLYIARRSNREGSRIRTKLMAGALALSVVPAIFLVLFSYSLLNINLRRWFARPGETINQNLIEVSNAFSKQHLARLEAEARWLQTLPEFAAAVRHNDIPSRVALRNVCKQHGISYLATQLGTAVPKPLCGDTNRAGTRYLTRFGAVWIDAPLPVDLAEKQAILDRSIQQYDDLRSSRNRMNTVYLQYIALITVFILFVASWVALLLGRQISSPIAALLKAVSEVRRGNLSYRVKTQATDEMATLIRGFNEMMQELEANSRELESRRRFTEAILESIPTGVLSITADGRIQRVNRALLGVFSEPQLRMALHLGDLFPPEDVQEINYLMKRARRTGEASSQFELRTGEQVCHLSITVAALEERSTADFVVVVEDTSELLRAQRAAAWHEVARRIAHELKNPLTPISLCADRIGRQVQRGLQSPDAPRILRECSLTIAREVESVKNLVDEFSQFARFPAAQPVPADLNQVVRNGLAVFEDRLNGIRVHLDLSDLPLVPLDAEQMKRVIVNLVDNAAEAMQESLVKELRITTRASGEETVELVVADSGPGVSPEDKEKLFLPYFSTKARGTGLGLAIVNHILSEHRATIRVEDNRPVGACFVVELPTMAAATAAEPAEVRV